MSRCRTERLTVKKIFCERHNYTATWSAFVNRMTDLLLTVCNVKMSRRKNVRSFRFSSPLDLNEMVIRMLFYLAACLIVIL